jgi:hypothetical protein
MVHMHCGHEKFVGLEALHHILAGESLNAPPVNIMGRSKLWSGAHLAIEIRTAACALTNFRELKVFNKRPLRPAVVP